MSTRTMSRRISGNGRTAAPEFDFWKRLKEISLFFAGRSREHKTLRRLARKLESSGICHAFVGAMAVDFHHASANGHEYVRTTSDVNVLLMPQGLTDFRRLLVPKSYGPVPGRSRRFLDRLQRVSIGILLTGSYPGYDESGPITLPDPECVRTVVDGIQVADLRSLVEMKLAARRHQDLADVTSLIASQKLDKSYAVRLHPSVRGAYTECLEEKRREDEYIKLNG
jgi:hypothetical protein